MRRRGLRYLPFALLLACGGYGPTSGGRGSSWQLSAVSGREVGDEQFPIAVHDLLLASPKSKEYGERATRVLTHQWERSRAQFRDGFPENGVAMVLGGLLLAAPDPETKDILAAAGSAEALEQAALYYASKGDDGGARSVYEVLCRNTDTRRAKEAADHLEAVMAWTRDTSAAVGPVAQASILQKTSIRWAVVDASPKAKAAAVEASNEWLRRALHLREEFRAKRLAVAREEAQGAYRAFQLAPGYLVAVYLRHRDIAGALKELKSGPAAQIETGQLVSVLSELAVSPSSALYLEALRELKPLLTLEGDDGTTDGADARFVFQSLSLVLASEAYRLEPTNFEAAFVLASALHEFGLTEAGPLVLADAVDPQSDPRILSGALALLVQGVMQQTSIGNVEGALRTFSMAKPVLEKVEKSKNVGKVQPSPAKVRALVGEIELREGRVKEAKSLFTQALSREPSVPVLLSLARIERHQRAYDNALLHVGQALASPEAANDKTVRAEILLLKGEIANDKLDSELTKATLLEALGVLKEAQHSAHKSNRPKVERILARVYDRFGADASASRALERALQASPGDKQQLAATIGQMVGRALVRGDLNNAKDALSRAMSADVPTEDLVYFALWVRLIEKSNHVSDDGLASRVFSSLHDDGRWLARLAAFGAGRIHAKDLQASAKTPTQVAEALFYSAMERRAAGDMKEAESRFREVLATGGVELMETAFARDLLQGSLVIRGLTLPKTLDLP